MKYIIATKPGQFDRIRIGFAPETHKQLAAGLIDDGFTPTSAGFVDFQDGCVRCHGWSESLHLAPAANDAALIQAMRNASARTAA